MSLLLVQNILTLFLMMAIGFAIAKSKLLKPSDSKALSIASLYAIIPCTIVSSLQVERTPEVLQGALVALIGAVVSHLLFIALARLVKGPLKLDAAEQTSLAYTNCGTYIIPLVVMVLGQEYVIYCTVYLATFNAFMWTHARIVLGGRAGLKLRGLLLNVNMIAVYLGAFMFVTGLDFPPVVENAIDGISSMLGPAAMLAVGMVLAGVDLKMVRGYKKLPLVTVLRLLVFPLVLLALLKLTPLAWVASLSSNGTTVLLVILMAGSAPSALVLAQLAQACKQDFTYCSAISVATLIFSIFTLPLMVFLYTL
jgi:malate permease and related proteins